MHHVNTVDEAELFRSIVTRILASGSRLQTPGSRLKGHPSLAGLSGYERQKARMRLQASQTSEVGRDIGPLPAVVDPDRREACEHDLGLYLKTYHPRAFPLPWSEDHLVLLKRAQLVILVGALFAVAMPRGAGKTTTCRHAIQWAINYGHARYAFLIGANDEKGEESLDVIQSDYETNELLLEDFPEICYPLVKLDGIHNRAKGQTLHGQPTRIKFKKRTLILPTVAGSVASGAVIKTGGLLSSVRGANHRLTDGTVIRPDLILLDDPSTRESAESPPQNATRIRIVTADVLGMAGPGGKIAALMPCTVIAPGDLADTVLDNEKHPEWRGLRTSMLVEFPDRMDLWEEYWDLFCNALKARGDLETFFVPPEATEFYRSHRKQMDAGGIVSWEERKRPDELSGLQHAMNLFFRDEAAFFSEYQNDPRDPHSDEEFLNAAQICRKRSQYARHEVPLNVNWLVSFLDVHKRALVWMVCGFEWDFTGHLIDYGIFPEQASPNWRMARARPTLAQRYPKSGDAAIYKGLQELGQSLIDRTFRREDGVMMRIEKGLIDQGHEKNTVQRVIRERKWQNTWYPSFGKEITGRMITIGEYRQRHGEMIGDDWVLKKSKSSMRHLMFDVNIWKTFAHRRLATPMGEPGSFSLFGREPGKGDKSGRKADHDYLARQLDSETRTVLTDGDRRIDQWRQKPASENHWFDCLVGCHVAGSLCGARVGGQAERAKKTKRTFGEIAKDKRSSR